MLQHIVVGTPGRLLELVQSGDLKLGNVKHFVIDECDKILEEIGSILNSHYVCLLIEN